MVKNNQTLYIYISNQNFKVFSKQFFSLKKKQKMQISQHEIIKTDYKELSLSWAHVQSQNTVTNYK